ncbi:hypothetical protein [Aestuariivirga sp.]|uniref:hypothetical protein n=1 Tax=Aestuariivirga sp. TaxID=2650926 RepID=UPI003BAD860D
MMGGLLEEPFNFTGTLYVLQFHWFWLLVSMGLGAWVGWRTAAEGSEKPQQP